ncbi:MAG: tRNA nucleotidyltransferase, partial [Bacillota bacterium]|nr:tRNA nucleotidyltransferase [Bacillota bacterium]
MIELPDEIIHIIQTIEAAGFEAYAVGGCVRDSILGRQAEDWDLTTNAARGDLASLFPDASIINKKLGVMRITEGEITADVAAYRIDGEYIDYRRPETVIFTGKLSEDLKRRDFTMNAIAVSPFRGEVDLYQGREDIASKRIRGIGEPGLRFEEDALRILRGIRFSAQLGFDVEQETLGAMKEKAGLLSHISLERVLDEFCKTVSAGSCSKGLKLLTETCAWRSILGEECFCHATSSEWEKLSLLGEGIDDTKTDLAVRLGLIYLSFQKNNARRAIEYLGYANRMKQRLLLVAEYMDKLQEIDKVKLKRLICQLGTDRYEYLDLVSGQQCKAFGLRREREET